MTNGYDSVRRLVHEHLIPALERLAVLASHLRGLSKSYVSNTTLGLSTSDLNSILDCVGCLQLVAHHLLRISAIEIQQFHAFAAWFHQEIGVQSSESDPSENMEKGPTIDYERTLAYIQGASRHSRLNDILKTTNVDDHNSRLDLAADGSSLFEFYGQKTAGAQKDSGWQQLPGLQSLRSQLESLCNALFAKVAEAQRRNVRFGSPIDLGVNEFNHMDMKMVQEVG